MSFLCNVAAGQHTPKSILESPEPRNVILAPALTRACHGAATVAATVAATAAATAAATGGGVQRTELLASADGAVDRRHFAGWGSAP